MALFYVLGGPGPAVSDDRDSQADGLSELPFTLYFFTLFFYIITCLHFLSFFFSSLFISYSLSPRYSSLFSITSARGRFYFLYGGVRHQHMFYPSIHSNCFKIVLITVCVCLFFCSVCALLWSYVCRWPRSTEEKQRRGLDLARNHRELMS